MVYFSVFLVATYSKHILLCITKQAAPRSPLVVVASRSVRDLVAPPHLVLNQAKEKFAQRSDSVSEQSRIMGKKASSGTLDDSSDTAVSLPTTNGSQLVLYPWMRELEANKECFDADESYFISTGSFVNNSGKSVYATVEHAVMARAGFIAKERYGIMKPIPIDGFCLLYTSPSPRDS